MPDSKKTPSHQQAVWDDLPPITTPVYTIDEKPERWVERLLYGWQHTLVDISPFILPLGIAGALGMSATDEAQFINFCLFAMGVATILQTTIGNRLPIIQGPSATLVGTLAPLAGHLGGPAMWGGIFVGGLVEMFIGASRVLTYLRRLFPPVVSGVVILSIALALGQLAVRLMIGDGAALNFILAGVVIGLIFVLQVSFRNVWGGLVARLGAAAWGLFAEASPPQCSPWNISRSGRFVQSFLILGRAFRHDEDLAVASLADTHGDDPFHVANRHMNRSAIAGVHWIERNRASGVLGSLDGTLDESGQGLLSLFSTAFDIDYDSWRILALAHRDLVRHKLQRVCGAAVSNLQCLRRRSSKLKDQIVAFGGLRNFEVTQLHTLNSAEQVPVET
ncbi:MAG: purine/pyrimidine permease [Gemmatimonadetes bacterium]|nr:purine/pyrimidine permease [Gemmatimonadota bacterium]